MQKWRDEADQAAAKVERLESIQQRARAEADKAKHAEKEWMEKAREARTKAQQLAARRSRRVDSLEAEKEKLKARLEANEDKIHRVEAVEAEAEGRAALRRRQQEIEDQRAALAAQQPLDSNMHTDTLRQTFGSADGHHKVQTLEAELQRQIREYKEAREMVSKNAHQQKEHAKEKELMDEISHIKQARVALIEVCTAHVWRCSRNGCMNA